MHASPFRALARYRLLPSLVGWPALLIALGARAPFAMIPLGTMTAVTAATGSVATGGLATGIVSVSAAVASPLIGRWADRHGQRGVLLVLAPLAAAALMALYLAARWAWSGPALALVCVAAGATTLPIGSFTRARWVALTRTPHELGAAFSYESMADELTFVLGPALVGVAASLAAPSSPLLIAMVLVLVATIPFALTAPRPAAAPGDRHEGPHPSIGRVLRSVAPAIAVMVSIGALFGSTQAATTARAEALGQPGVAGLVYAVMGVGSATMSLLVVLLPDSLRLSHRILIGGAAVAALISLVAAQSGLVGTALCLLLVGAFVGPTMVTAFSLAEHLAPSGGLSVAMTSLSASVTVGVSLGSTIGGRLATSPGPVGAFALGAAAGLVIAVTGAALWVGSRRRRRVSERPPVRVG